MDFKLSNNIIWPPKLLYISRIVLILVVNKETIDKWFYFLKTQVCKWLNSLSKTNTQVVVFHKRKEIQLKNINNISNNLCQTPNQWVKLLSNKFQKEIRKQIYTKHNNKEKLSWLIVEARRLLAMTCEVAVPETPTLPTTNTKVQWFKLIVARSESKMEEINK